ncbi:helix-turn-helix domain-containing protein [Roseinatronobacter sp.]
MSREATGWAGKQKGLKPATWRVLMNLADRHNPDYGCFPDQGRIAADCEMSRRSVNNHLERLVQMGLIRRERRINPKTRKQMSTRYILGFEDDFTQEPCANTAHGIDQKPCAKNDQSRVQNLHTNLVREPVSTTKDFPAETPDPALRCLNACGPGLSEYSRSVIRDTDEVIHGWIEAGADLEADVLPVLRERTATARDRVIRTWDYFTQAVRARQTRREAQAARAGKNAEKQHVRSAAPDSDHVAYLARWINSGARVPPSAVTNTQRDALLARGLVSEAQLRALQIY